LKNEKPAEWTAEERERIFESLSETPKLLKGLDIEGIYRMSESVTPENPAASYGPYVVVYNRAFEPEGNLTQVLDHEFAHRLYGALSDKERTSFRNAAKWSLDDAGNFVCKRPMTHFVRKNEMLSPDEDFADGVAIYIHEPTKLKQASPEVFGWMDRHVKPKLMTGTVK